MAVLVQYGNGGEEEEDEEWGVDQFETAVQEDLRRVLKAAEEGDTEALRRALDNLTGSIDGAGDDGDTALHLACLYGHLNCVQMLLAAGARLDVRDEDGAIPLHDACAGGYLDIVQTLLSVGSREQLQSLLEAADVDGDTPLHHAARGHHVDVVEMLLSYGASARVVNAQSKTPAELADPGSRVQEILDSLPNQ